MKQDLTRVMIQDYLLVQVPVQTVTQYYLKPGFHRLIVIRSLAAKPLRKYKVRCHGCCLRCDPFTVTIQDDGKLFAKHGPRLFLQRDKYPVTYRHDQNLVNRLKRSIPSTTTKKGKIT